MCIKGFSPEYTTGAPVLNRLWFTDPETLPTVIQQAEDGGLLKS